MVAALRRGEIDAALLLTEAAVAAVAEGGFKIASLYTESPLIWGIHVPAVSSLRTLDDLRGARYAISRLGSGSHLMAFVHARAAGWVPEALELVVVGNLTGAIEAFATDKADVFFWEKFMTKPLVDAGRFRRIGEFIAPWPAFVVCVADAVKDDRRRAIGRLLDAVLARAQALAVRPDAPALVGARYSLDPYDVAEWLEATRWPRQSGIAIGSLAAAAAALQALGLVAAGFDPTRALATFTEFR
jgi:ABC-type nitrate/sulfonate/bicarbonate transport system substrate-binding protein